MTARTMPMPSPSAVAANDSRSVFRNPVTSRSGRTCCIACRSRKFWRMLSSQFMIGLSPRWPQRSGAGHGLRRVLTGHRHGWEVALVQAHPRAVLDRRAQAAVERVAQRRVALLDREAGGGVERRDVRDDLQAGTLLGVVLRRRDVKEVRVDAAAADRGDGGVVVREAHELGLGEVLERVLLLQRALQHAEALAGEAVGAGHGAAVAGEDRQVADEVAVGEVDRLLAIRGDADRGGADVVLAVVDRGEQAREVLARELRAYADALSDVLEQLDVEAGEGAVRVGVRVGLGVADA